MPKSVQAKLLRVIQDGVVRRVGSEATDAVVNIRLIACTNANPEAAVKAGILREDLYYRLRVVPIHVPPLRDRPEDVELLAEHFLAYYWSRHHGPTMPRPKFRDAAVRALRARPWEGNVRELQNIIEHMVVLLEPRTAIEPRHIPELGYQPAGAAGGGVAPAASSAVAPAASSGEPYYAARDRLVNEFALQYFAQLVTRVGGNMSEAARVAGVDRATLYRMMKRYGVHVDVSTPKDNRPATLSHISNSQHVAGVRRRRWRDSKSLS
jgi:DNA-binding NtrC family response regulator